MLGGDRQPVGHRLHHLGRRDIAGEVAAEGSHHADALDRDAGGDMGRRLPPHRLDVSCPVAVQVSAGEGL
ncbi:hypothetical protein ACFQU7_32720 [Pseudoroseomonas wenyumeiae]